MYLHKLFLLCLLCCTCIAKEEDVLEFSDVDFESLIGEHETALVMFYAPWCGHCKMLKPEYYKAAEDLIQNDPPIALIKVDCTEEGKETCTKYEVDGYPTLKIFRNGQFSQAYGGPRQAAGIVKYMKAQVGPSSRELKSVEDLETFLKAEKGVAVVGFFEKESELKVAFLELADRRTGKVRFAHFASKVVLQKQNVSDEIFLFRPAYLHNKFEDDSVVYTGKATADDIDDFISKSYHGLVGIRKPDNMDEFKNPLIVAYYTVDYVKNSKVTHYWRNRMLTVAKRYKDQVNFAISREDDFQEELNEYEIDFVNEDKPVVLATDVKKRKFVMNESFSVEVLDQFVHNLLANNLQPYLKSGAIPENNDGPVKVAVAKSFDDVVTNNGKDTLIEFYTPWCDDCRKLAPVYDKLGRKMKNENVEIVKMDVSVNTVPSNYDVSNYPVLYWAPKDSKSSPRVYEGGHELEDFVKFIAQHATSELKGYDREGNLKVEKVEL